MNDPSSNGNENTIDIFILCKSESVAPLNTEHLEQKGYRVTLFSDINHLFETLRFGKPNLLICDSLSLGDDAFGICRQIKADNDLWMIPVLIMTRASSLTDLLFVLDCNADNFIAYPYDPPYLHSLIEGILVTPVERQTPEQIKTQFKIQHDEHLFVVTADRRKLLEFLLSSFEIAVNKSDELARATSEITLLRQAAAKADEVAADQARIIEVLNGTLRQREQAISALNDELRDKAQQIADLSRDKEFLVQEREAGKNLLLETEDKVRILVSENEDMARTHSTEFGELGQRFAATTEELATVQADLRTTREALNGETARRTELEATLATLVPANEQLEKTFRALTLECEQAKSACSAEKNRALAAEQENKSLVLAKVQSEQDLTRIIDELKNTARQQATEIVEFREELGTDKGLISTLETRLVNLTAEKEQVEGRLKNAADDLRRELDAARATCDTTTATLNEKSSRITELEQAYSEQKSEMVQSQSRVESLENELGALRSALEEKIRNATELERVCAEQKSATAQSRARVESLENELGTLRSAIEEKTQSVAELEQVYAEQKSATAQSRARVESLENELGTLRSAIEEKTQSVADLEHICNELKTAGAQALAQIRALDTEIGELRASLDGERQQHAATRESLQGALRERDSALSSLQGAHEEVKSDLSSHRDDLALLKQEFATVSGERTALNTRLTESLAQIRALDDKLHAASSDQADSDKQIRSLSDELEQVKASLETERQQRRSSEENIHSAVQAGEKAGEMLRQAALEREHLQKLLDSEREELRNAEERLRSLEDEGENRMKELSTELAGATDRLRELTGQMQIITQEKRDAEERAAAFEAEIEQARAALADEWEDHMTDNERFAAIGVQVEKPAEPAPIPEPAHEGRAIITHTSDLPVEMTQGPRAVVAVPAPAEESNSPRVTSVEDLFEDETEIDNSEELAAVSIIRDPAQQVTPDDIVSESDPVLDDDETDEHEEPDEGDDAEVLTGSALSFQPVIPGPGVAFDRSQWLDLLKWAHHSGALSQDQRLQIVRMGRLIQKGRRLTRRQDEQVRNMIALVQSLGYRLT